MTYVSRRITIHVPDNGIWQVIGDFGASGQYLSGVVRCMVEGVGVGARRTLTSTDDSTVVERLETLDEAAHRLSYALLTNTPFRNCLTTMTVHDLGSNQAELVWLAAFEPDGLPAREAAELMERRAEA